MSRKHFHVKLKKTKRCYPSILRAKDPEIGKWRLMPYNLFFLGSFGGVQNVVDSPKIHGFFIVNLLDG